ncbi:hypothetical protein SRO_6684 [Streptomyces rochei]|nr:hypothetical protein SRO_6684 [Streptomyces rochei]
MGLFRRVWYNLQSAGRVFVGASDAPALDFHGGPVQAQLGAENGIPFAGSRCGSPRA